MTIKLDEPKSGERRQFILVPKRIDNLNVVYTKKLMTPAVCKFCGADMCAINKLPFYRKLDEETQVKMRMVLKEHIDKLHGPGAEQVFYEDDAPFGCLNEQVLTKKNYKRIMDGLNPDEDAEE